MNRCTVLALLACTMGAPPAAGSPGPSISTTIPSDLVSAVEGCWKLGSRYQILLRRSGPGMKVQQDTVNKRGNQVRREETVLYKPSEKILGFTGIGDIHRVIVILRWINPNLDASFNSEISAGEWLEGHWSRAQRCSATTGP